MNKDEIVGKYNDISSFEGDVDELIELVDRVVKAGKVKLIQKSVGNKNFRPPQLRMQFELLLYISRLSGVDAAHRIFSGIASCHKSLELVDDALIDVAFKNLDVVFKELYGLLGASDNIREDKTHAYSSYLSVNMHLAMLKGNYNFFHDKRDDIFDWVRNNKSITLGYYQSCTNIARVLGFLMISNILYEEMSLTEEIFLDMKRVMRLGADQADFHPVKFDEYLEAVNILFNAKEVLRVCELARKNGRCYLKYDDELPPFLKLGHSIFRKHGKEKSDIIYANMRKLVESMSVCKSA